MVFPLVRSMLSQRAGHEQREESRVEICHEKSRPAIELGFLAQRRCTDEVGLGEAGARDSGERRQLA